MYSYSKIDEFRREADNALFTKEQALQVVGRLFDLQLVQPENSPEDIRILTAAKQKVNMSYFDATSTEIDQLLDAAAVARLTAANIADAIDVILFEAK